MPWGYLDEPPLFPLINLSTDLALNLQKWYSINPLRAGWRRTFGFRRCAGNCTRPRIFLVGTGVKCLPTFFLRIYVKDWLLRGVGISGTRFNVLFRRATRIPISASIHGNFVAVRHLLSRLGRVRAQDLTHCDASNRVPI